MKKTLLVLGLSLLSFFAEAQTRQLISIPAYAGLPSITRKAEVTETVNKYEFQNAIVSVKVHHYLNGIEQKYLNGTVYLIANNSNKVNPQTGAYCSDTTGCIGEYIYLWNIVNVGKAFTQVQLEDMYISLRVTEINERLYNK